MMNACVIGQSFSLENGDSVTLTADCIDGGNLQLKLNNHTDWSVGVGTFSTYYGASKYRPLKLPTGVTVYAMPNDKLISSLYYATEIESRISDGRSRLEVRDVSGHGGATSWIPAKDSVIFQVPIADLTEESRIFVKINYDWELVRANSFNYGKIEHRVYYQYNTPTNRKIDLPKCRNESAVRARS